MEWFDWIVAAHTFVSLVAFGVGFWLGDRRATRIWKTGRTR